MKNEFRSWSNIRIFLAVVREGSTLAASRGLGIAQPTVARRIEALEKETGLTLFEHDTRGFKATPEARRLLPLAEAIENAAMDFAAASRDLKKQRPIRITSPGSFSERALSIFSDFTALNPEVAFEFIHSVKVLNLSVGEADIALRVIGNEPDERLICRKLGTERWALYAGRNYVDNFGVPPSLDNLRGHRFITFVHDGASDFLHEWLVQHVSPDQIVSSFGDLDLMLASIRSGQGMGLVPIRFVEADDAFIRCSAGIEALERPVVLLIAPDAYRRPEVKAFTKFFAPRFSKFCK